MTTPIIQKSIVTPQSPNLTASLWTIGSIERNEIEKTGNIRMAGFYDAAGFQAANKRPLFNSPVAVPTASYSTAFTGSDADILAFVLTTPRFIGGTASEI
jgi:hypothetical protein